MRKFTTNIDARSLLNSLAEAGHLDAAASAEAEGYVTEQTKDRELPLHLRVLAGFGAFIAAVCFFGFLMAAHVIRFKDGAGMMAWGVAFIVIAIVVALPLRAKCNTVGQNFALMLSLANMGVGKLMFVAGFAELYGTRNGWGVVIGILMVTVGTYFFYRLSIDRFLGVLALLVAVVIVYWDAACTGRSCANNERTFRGAARIDGVAIARREIKARAHGNRIRSSIRIVLHGYPSAGDKTRLLARLESV